MHSRLVLVAFFLVTVPRIAQGVEADLSKASPGTTQTVSVPADNPLQVKLVNKAPGDNYKYSKSLIIRNIEVASLPPLPKSGTRSAAPPCTEITNLRNAAAEKDVPGLIAALRKAILDTTSCNEADGLALIDSTQEILGSPYTLRPGQELVLTVERQADATATPKVEKAIWTFVWTTGPRGDWKASYGFGFFEDEDEEYFTRAGEEEGTFVIHREEDRSDLSFAPAVFFTWSKESRKLQDWDHGPTGGLGFDLSKPVVFAGWQVTYNQNYTLNLGLVARPERNLEGQYEVGQVLKENLKESQIHDDSSYGVAGFAGLSFRFSKSPFEKSGGDGK